MAKPSVLKNRDFRNLFYGQTISQLGDSVYFLVFLFMADHVSKDPMVVGLVGALQALPFVFFGPIAGVVADRVDRRKIMLFADIASAALTGVLAIYAWFFPSPAVWVLCVSAFLLSLINSFFMPARSASIPRLVAKEQVMEATGLAVSVQQLMGMIGLAISASVLGVIYSIAPEYFFFSAVIVNSLTFGVSAIFIARLPGIVPERVRAISEKSKSLVANFRQSLSEFWSELASGIRVMRADPVIRVALPINMVSNLCVSGFMVIYLALNRDWYGGSFTTLAWMEFSFMAAMMVLSLAVSRSSISRPGLAFALGTVALGLFLGLMSISRPYWAMILMNILCGMALPFVIVPLNAYLQLAIDDSVRGRVNSAWGMVTMAMQPLGIAIVGPLLVWLGISGVFVAMGVGMILGGLYGLVNRTFTSVRVPTGEST